MKRKRPHPLEAPIDADHWPVRISAALLGQLVRLARSAPDRTLFDRLMVKQGERLIAQAMVSMRAELCRRLRSNKTRIRGLLARVIRITPSDQVQTVLQEFFPDIPFERLSLELDLWRRAQGIDPQVGPLDQTPAQSAEDTQI